MHIKIKISEVFFVVTGILILVSLFFIESSFGVSLWLISKVTYFIGLLFFVINLFLKK